MPRISRAAAVAIATLTLGQTALRADVRITEMTAANIGGRSVQGTRSTSIRNLRMRIESTQADNSVTTLYDLPAGETISLDAKKKHAQVRDLTARERELQRQYPHERVAVSLTPTQVTKDIAGESCDEHAFTIRVPMNKEGDLALILTGSAWLARTAPGASDYATFAKAAMEHHVVLGFDSDNRFLMAFNRAQTDLYRALAERSGIPYLIDMTLKVDGHGVVAAMLRKILSGTRTSTVPNVVAMPLAEDAFVVPGGWKRQKK